jgi:hypothetical protein
MFDYNKFMYNISVKPEATLTYPDLPTFYDHVNHSVTIGFNICIHTVKYKSS